MNTKLKKSLFTLLSFLLALVAMGCVNPSSDDITHSTSKPAYSVSQNSEKTKEKKSQKNGKETEGKQEKKVERTTARLKEVSSSTQRKQKTKRHVVNKDRKEEKKTEKKTIRSKERKSKDQTFSFKDIPEYSGSSYYTVNSNIPFFTAAEKSNKKSFEKYSDLDSLGRCGVAMACIGRDIQPTEPRGDIGMIRPSGWHTVKYDCVDGKYLYNRCHLIGFQLTGENANEKNLITGTRYMNVVGMLDFENKVDDYLEAYDRHVLYRVTPVFVGKELVARGVLMEAFSIEDNGKGVCFNVFCYNVQPSISISYLTGASQLADANPLTTVPANNDSSKYVLNTNSKKFHFENCSAVSSMSEKNKESFAGSRNTLIHRGYAPCKICNP